MSNTRIYTETPPFWRRFSFFFSYLAQEKLYFQITLLALLNLLLIIPSFIIQILVQITLFLASYKLAFEVLSSVSRGEFQYRDSFSFHITELIGFKALGMPVLQLLIFIFVVRYDPTTGFILLLLSTLLTPAFLMLLAQSQSLVAALNPITQVQIATRIGAEYLLLTLFFVLLAGFNLFIRNYLSNILPTILSVVLLAWVLYFLLIFTFSVIGYVMYRHADSMGHETMDHQEDQQSTASHSQFNTDPIKQRIEDLIDSGDGQQAMEIIQELSISEGRTDLNRYLSDAQKLAKQQRLTTPADRLQQLVVKKQFRKAMQLIKEYYDDGHLIKPNNADVLYQLIAYSAHNNQHAWVIRLFQHLKRIFPKDHQTIVNAGHLAAQSLYHMQDINRSQKLLENLITQYQLTADISQLTSYLIGIQKLQKKPTE